MNVKTEIKDESTSSSDDELVDTQYDPSDITQYDLAIRWISSEEFSQETLTKIQKILCEALEERIDSVNIITDLSLFHSINTKSNDIVLVFKFTESTCFKQLILGPTPTDIEAVDKFRYYWGESCELRRFRDGRLLYVVPSERLWMETYSCNEYFIKLLITKHFNVNENQLVSNLTSITSALPPFSQCLEVIECISELSNLIKDLNLPLSINTVKSFGSYTRYTSYSIPQRIKDYNKIHQYMHIDSIPLIIKFEDSNKWPDELHGIKLMKSAFSIKIKELLRAQSILGKVFPNRFELYYKGYIFNILFDVPQELALLRMGTGDDVEDYINKYQRIPLTSLWMSQFPGKYPALTQSSRLLKKWLSSRMFSNYFSDGLIDAMTIHFFLNEPIHSPQKFFLTFIETLATNDSYPIYFGDSFDVESSHGIVFNFEDQPEVSKYLNSIAPSIRVVKYLCGVAKQCWKLLDSNFCLKTGVKFNKALFSAHLPKGGIQIILDKLLLTKQNVNYNEACTSNTLSLLMKEVAVIDFDPLKLFTNELNRYFGTDILLFVDLLEGSTIVLMFNPSTTLGKVITEKNESCELSTLLPKESIMTYGELKKVIKLMGGSLVKDVTIL
ncbi:nucleolar RNA-associated protein, putative [Entamoeba histolytica KU27]|uniref:Nucleolar RNA-associated protein, putative n=1 Tax=Entamoeba histolytica KU27 TaxID=885311 RepID=M2QIC2_ENTHI|nr:nucleolar RNA-associated protein, putative [Entamoeba histolytica KU27]